MSQASRRQISEMRIENPSDAANSTRSPTLGLVVSIAAIMATLILLDRFLAKTEQVELRREAQHLYVTGSRLLAEGKANQAVDLLRRAHALVRRNGNYQLELIDALMAAGKIGEAGPLMENILQREPNNGRANLIAARMMVQTGKAADASSYYHRAIYGVWPDGAAAHRISARMELVDFLARHGGQKELLAELLPLEQEAGGDSAIRKKLAHLFLLAGSASRAADVYHALLQQDPNDTEAYSGLGEAELQRGRYRAAQAAFLSAFRRKPGSASIRQRMELSSMITALDPTSRSLPSIEKYRRSLRILEFTRASLERCSASRPAVAHETAQLLTAAQAAFPKKPPAQATNELAEEKLALAEEIWQARIKACGAGASREEEALRLLMEKLAQ